VDSFMRRVSALQTELKAPKGQTNSFGGYKYRSCEDILEAVKPLLAQHHMVLTISDDMIQLGDRYYICATATLRDTESESILQNSAYAREAESKKGMDDSQVTGATSSYARKYALNGLFCIDDAKDADTDAFKRQQQRADEKPGSRIPPEGDAPVICEDCGKRIPDYFDGNDLIKASRLAERSINMHGRVLCTACGKKAAV